ncbi:MAG TPA: YiaA/YiaB family inner membrane protein [Actinoplanes sp.]|nr:YiaA/YiaB family inner membrane protein [Actinoplanes sp.]
MDTNSPSRPTAAFFAQAVASFGISLTAVTVGIAYLPVGGWIRAFLAIGVLYVVTSAFTLAKVIRDQQESSSVVKRVDQARIDKLLADHDPFTVPGAAPAPRT